jgi:hypothetical protein
MHDLLPACHVLAGSTKVLMPRLANLVTATARAQEAQERDGL